MPAAPPGIGLLKGLGVTLKHMFKRASTQQYPHVRPDLPPRTRGVIGLMDENCTVCMLCARECPDWCIYIDSHKETVPPAKEGGRVRTRNVLDRFAIDFALCMYCGICIEVCPFDALFWSPEFEYAEYEIGGLLHEMDELRAWTDTVPPPPALDEGAVPLDEVSDAIASAVAKVDAERQQQQAAPVAAEPADAGGEPVAVTAGTAETPTETVAETAAETPEDASADAPAQPRAGSADVHVEGAGEIDQQTYDQLVAEGKSERVARSKAKAAWVRQQKKALQADDGGDA